MARPRGNNVPTTFCHTWIGSAADQTLVQELYSSPYLPHRVHLIDVGTYVLEFEAVPREGEPRHTATIVLTAENVPLTLESPAVRLLSGTDNGLQLVAEY
jgi:hypothetical protein